MSTRRSKLRRRAGHLLVEALAAGVLLSLTIAALAAGEVASRRSLVRSIEALEMERAATERLEYLRSQPTNSPAWAGPSGGAIPGHPGWAWTITPEFLEDRDVRVGFPSFRYVRARVVITAGDGRFVTRDALRW